MEHGPVFGWPILIYFFLSGTSGGAFICATLLTLFVKKTEKIKKLALYESIASLGCLSVGSLCLFFDLGQPLRSVFLLAIPMLNPTSPLAWGSFFILSNFVLLFGYIYAIQKDKDQLARILSFIGVFIAAGLVCYTGFILSVSDSLLWQSAILVPLFFASGCISGLSLLFLLGTKFNVLSREDSIFEPLRKILLIMIVVDGAILTDYYIVYSAIVKGYESAKIILSGQFSFAFWGGEVILGIILPVVLLLSKFGKTAKGMFIISLLAMFGVFIMRYIIIFAGQA